MENLYIESAEHQSWEDMLDVVGHENFLRLSELMGGQTIYIPQARKLTSHMRNRAICRDFNGKNVRALALQYRLSDRQIRRILTDNGIQIFCKTSNENNPTST